MGEIRRIDVVQTKVNAFGTSVPGSETELALIFNEDVIHEELVHELIESGDYIDDDRIVITTPKRADLLLSGK